MSNKISKYEKLMPVFPDFDWTDITKRLDAMQSKLNKYFKTTDDEIKVTVPYDRNTETLKAEIANNMLTVTVKSDGNENEFSSKTFSTSLPSDFDEKRYDITHKYDSEKKSMTIQISLK